MALTWQELWAKLLQYAPQARPSRFSDFDFFRADSGFMTTKPPCRPTVSAVIPVYNGLPFLDECLESLLNQETSAGLSLEICVYNDGSTDGTHDSILRWKQRCEERSIPFKYGKGDKPGGVGYAKNRAVHLSSGEFLCFCDADDVSFPRRIQMQHDFTVSRMGGDKVLICGSKFVRNDENATTRYTKWANELSDNQLLVQRFTSHGPTVVAPTWFLLRSLYDKVGGFSEDDVVGHPEDLQFFFKALSLGATVIKVPDCLVMYRYHPNCATFSVTENSIWNMRILELQRCVLSKWDRFTIWNAGKQGKKFYKSLSLENRAKVSALCDVDSSKIRHGKYEIYDERERKIVDCVPIISQKDAVPPVIVCVKLDLTDGGFENLLKEKNWTEGVDYFHFS